MDQQLRANPDDVLALMRAGRLSRERVAMAAYLGDERALVSGVEPWKPSFEDRHPPGLVVQRGDLTHRQRVWLACLMVEQADQVGHSNHDFAPKIVETVRAWCLGATTAEAVDRVVSEAPPAEIRLGSNYKPRFDSLLMRAVATAKTVTEPEKLSSEYLFWDGSPSLPSAIADLLLDSDWPPWEE